MSAREEILARLKPTGAGSIEAEAAALLVAPERPEASGMSPVDAFVAKLALPGIAATCDRISTLADSPAAIMRYCTEHGLPPALFVPPDPRLDSCDWSAFNLHATAAIEEPIVLAVARCGVAETGSLIFETAPAAPMLPNFVALHHIVLVAADAIVPHLEDAILPGQQPRAHYWVTGVSGTTDIEGTYVRGAHGPRFLHVTLVEAPLPG